MRVLIAGLLLTLTTACGAGSSVLERHPELAPGTTWEAWTRARSADAARSAGNETADGGQPTLGDIAAAALERSPEVRAALKRWEAAVEAAGGAGLPPRPTLSYTWLPLPVETRVGPNEHRVALTQRLPSLPAQFAKHDASVHRADAARAAWETAALDALTRARVLVAEVRYLQEALRLLAASEALAIRLLAAARQRHEEGTGLLFDVTKAESQLAQLGYDRVRFRELLEGAEGRLNALLDAPVDRTFPPLPAWPSRMPSDREVLYAAALERSPRIAALDYALEAGRSDLSAAKGGLFPDVTIGAQWMINGDAANAVADSGQDAVGITIGLSLPLWFGAERSRITGARAALDAVAERKRAYINRLLAAIKDEHLRLVNARRLVTLYDATLIPQARGAMEDSEAWRRAGAGAFADLLEARNALHRYELARARAQADVAQAEARLDGLIGGTEVSP